MLTLNTSGKSGADAVELVRASLKNEDEIKILIDGPAQSDSLMKFLTSEGGFPNVTLEDDDGLLYVVASGRKIESDSPPESEPEKILLAPINNESEPQEIKNQESKPEPEPEKIIAPVKNVVVQDSLGVILSYENKKYRPAFMQKFIQALADSQIKPSIIALLDNAVNLAAYDSKTCEYLKNLESNGVQVLISDSCADRLGLTEALGTGILTDMSEILEKIFTCEKIVSL